MICAGVVAGGAAGSGILVAGCKTAKAAFGLYRPEVVGKPVPSCKQPTDVERNSVRRQIETQTTQKTRPRAKPNRLEAEQAAAAASADNAATEAKKRRREHLQTLMKKNK